jgi:cell division septal protein FtsQ
MKWRLRRPRLPRMPRASRRVLLGGGGLLALMVLWSVAPALLRRLAFFRVRQVELVGVRHLDPEAVIAALRLSATASVFDDVAILGDRLRGLNGVADARVVRRPPAALQVIVREVEPVALVASGRGALTVVDAGGHALAFESAGLDLPLVSGADSGVVGVLSRVQALDPALFQMVDAARRLNRDRGDVVLECGPHRMLLARDAGPEVVQAVALVARDLAAKSRRYAELDARYAGQIVVRRRASAGARAD